MTDAERVVLAKKLAKADGWKDPEVETYHNLKKVPAWTMYLTLADTAFSYFARKA